MPSGNREAKYYLYDNKTCESFTGGILTINGSQDPAQWIELPSSFKQSGKVIAVKRRQVTNVVEYHILIDRSENQ